MDKQPFNEKKSTSNHATDKKNKKKSFGFKKFFLALLTLFIVVFLGVGCGLVAIGLDGDKDVSKIIAFMNITVLTLKVFSVRFILT